MSAVCDKIHLTFNALISRMKSGAVTVHVAFLAAFSVMFKHFAGITLPQNERKLFYEVVHHRNEADRKRREEPHSPASLVWRNVNAIVVTIMGADVASSSR